MEKERFDKRLPLIPEYQGRKIMFEQYLIHPDKVFWNFDVNGQERRVPVFSIWNYEHHAEIVQMISQGKAAAMYMWGTYGTGMLLNSPEWQMKEQVESVKLRQHLKKDRPWSHQFANFMYPEDMIDFWDIDRFHPSYRRLQWAGNRQKLFEVGPVHIIAPTKVHNPHLDQSLVRTEDQTASYFYMPHPAWNLVVEMLRKEVKHAVFGGGSLNFHQEEPGFTTDVLYKMISQKPDWQKNIDFVIVDELAEKAMINRSQTQIRIPQVDSDGYCELVRIGGLAPMTWSSRTGYLVKDAPEGVKQASSATEYNLRNNKIINDRILGSKLIMERYHQSGFWKQLR